MKRMGLLGLMVIGGLVWLILLPPGFSDSRQRPTLMWMMIAALGAFSAVVWWFILRAPDVLLR